MLTVSPADTGRADLMRLLVTKWIPPVIGVLADLGVADQLVGGPLTAPELAERVGAHPVALRRLLRAAVSIGVFTTDGADDRFALNETAESLRSDVPRSLRAAATAFAREPFWAPYARIRHSVTTGEPAFDQMFGTTVYDYLAAHPDDAALFGAAAAGFHAEAVALIAVAHDFSAYGTVVDVGGGTGSLLAAVLRRHPGVRGVLLDLPDVVDAARATFEPDLAERVELVAGDFFRAVPPGDAFLLKSCLHNFDDDRASALLRAVRDAAPAGARLLVAETVVPAGPGPHYAKLDDVEMLVIAGGADRDEREYERLLEAARFTPQRLVPCGERFSLIEAVAS